MAVDGTLGDSPVPSQPGLEGKDLVVAGARRLLRQWRHDPALRQKAHEPPRPIHVFGGQTVGSPGAGTTASMARKSANDIVINLSDGGLRTLQPLSKVTSRSFVA
jgi:hypothetical protein